MISGNNIIPRIVEVGHPAKLRFSQCKSLESDTDVYSVWSTPSGVGRALRQKTNYSVQNFRYELQDNNQESNNNNNNNKIRDTALCTLGLDSC